MHLFQKRGTATSKQTFIDGEPQIKYNTHPDFCSLIRGLKNLGSLKAISAKELFGDTDKPIKGNYMTIIMGLLVRDEADIIKDNITFHLRMGVDHVIATDNNSVDGTREILWEFKEQGVLTLIDEPGKDHSQWRWVTRMANIARESFKATWFIPNDADEFWLPSTDFRSVLQNYNANVARCRRLNMFGTYCTKDIQPWWDRLQYRIAEPIRARTPQNFMTANLQYPYFYRALPDKVLVRPHDLSNIQEGNHSAFFNHKHKEIETDEIIIFHFPIRSRKQFISKVENTATSYEKNTELPKTTGWHQRRWHHLLKTKGVEESFYDAVPSLDQLKQDYAAGLLIKDKRLACIMNELSGFKL